MEATSSSVTLVVEDRGEDVEIREMAATVVRVVGDDHVAGLELVAEEVDGEPDGQGARQHELRDADRERGQAALRVEDRGVALVGLVQDRRRRRPGHVGRHFEADGLHGRSDDLCCDEIDLAGLRHGSPSGRGSCTCSARAGLPAGAPPPEEGYPSRPVPENRSTEPAAAPTPPRKAEVRGLLPRADARLSERCRAVPNSGTNGDRGALE